MSSVIRWGLGAGLLALVLTQSDWRAITEQLRGVPLSELAFWGLLNALVLVLMTARWRVLLEGLGADVPLTRLALHRLAGFGVSFLTPGPQFGGEPLQVLLLTRREGVPNGTAVSSVALDKMLDLVSSFAFLAIALGFLSERSLIHVDGSMWVRAMPLIPIVLVAGYFAGLAFGTRPLTSMIRRVRRAKLAKLLGLVMDAERLACDLVRDRHDVMVRAVALSALSWVVQVAEFWWMLDLLQADATFVATVSLLLLVRLAFLLPLPGGLGALEAALVLGASMVGLPEVLGLTAALMIRVRDLSLALSGAGWGLWATDRRNRADEPRTRASLGRSEHVVLETNHPSVPLLASASRLARSRPSSR